jgi:hypothetical protein
MYVCMYVCADLIVSETGPKIIGYEKFISEAASFL